MLDPNSKVTAKTPKIMSLANLPLNTVGIVKFINAGMKANRRLTGLGITPGIKITKLSEAPFHGPVQIEVRGTRLALGRGIANKIMVERYLT
ncbi:MAG: ferrous iron transport protein A [Promethearchaeia archaeon]|nr:MAG: ferrous iron transport protein A [Candidatus Lokiarchaeia archaeon]